MNYFDSSGVRKLRQTYFLGDTQVFTFGYWGSYETRIFSGPCLDCVFRAFSTTEAEALRCHQDAVEKVKRDSDRNDEIGQLEDAPTLQLGGKNE